MYTNYMFCLTLFICRVNLSSLVHSILLFALNITYAQCYYEALLSQKLLQDIFHNKNTFQKQQICYSEYY